MKTFHQFVSNLRAIAELFIAPNKVAEVFFASLKIVINSCFLRTYEIGGGG